MSDENCKWKVGSYATIFFNGDIKRITKVEKVLKTYLVVDGIKYEIGTGLQKGRDVWYSSSVEPTTPEHVNIIKKGNLVYKIGKTEFKNLTLEQLIQIDDIIKKDK